MSSSPDRGHDGEEPARVIEYYGEIVELCAAVILRQAGGWQLLSAGLVREGKIWAEFEEGSPPAARGA